MRAVVIGCGSIASRWVRALNADPRTEIAVLVDQDQAAADALAERFGLRAARATTLTETLDGHGVEVAINLTPPAAHAATSRAALEAGLHVLSEKPLALRLADAIELEALAAERGRVLAVMQNHAKDPGFAEFADDVRAAACDESLLVTGETFVPLHTAGFRRGQRYPVTSDLAVHAFDQVRTLISQVPAEVVCVETALPQLGGHCAVGSITVTFTDGSVLVWRGGFIASRQHRTAATGVWRAEWSGGAATWSADGGASFARGEEDAEISTNPSDGKAGYQLCITEMIDALHGEATGLGAASNLGSIALLEAALASAAHRSPEPVDIRPWSGLTAAEITGGGRG